MDPRRWLRMSLKCVGSLSMKTSFTSSGVCRISPAKKLEPEVSNVSRVVMKYTPPTHKVIIVVGLVGCIREKKTDSINGKVAWTKRMSDDGGESTDKWPEDVDTHLRLLKQQCQDLAYSERIAKEDAMTILEVMHRTEMIVLQCRYENERALASLHRRVEEEALTKRHTEQQEALQTEVSQLRQVLSQQQTSKRR